jgi:hypothetical protein
VIVLRFGKSGRLARICETAVRIAHPAAQVFSVTRERTFRADADDSLWVDLDSLLRSHADHRVWFLDASVDHSSSRALIEHEQFKRGVIGALKGAGVLERAVGFSSGIAAVESVRIQSIAAHMHEYRNQKLAQEALFASLDCPVYLPQVFTVVGPITYASQSAAWAQILKARLERIAGTVLNEPHAAKAWVSEHTLLRTLLEFLTTDAPEDLTGPLLSGIFTLAEIAANPKLPLRPLPYASGGSQGWLIGDYLPPGLEGCAGAGRPRDLYDLQVMNEELLRCIRP